jgi:type IV secretion system protein VirD4
LRDNEFRRKKPGKHGRGLAYDISNMILPAIFVFAGTVISTQKFAACVRYNPAYTGEPVFVTGSRIFGIPKGYPFFNPLEALLSMASGLLDNTVQNAILPTLFWFLSFAIFAVALYFLMGVIRGGGNGNDDLYGTARWAKEKDIKKFGLTMKQGVVLAQFYFAVVSFRINPENSSISLRLKHPSELVCHAGGTNTLLSAPTRSGKGVGSIIPTCLSYTGHMIILDPKGELWNITAGWRRKFSHVLKFSPVSEETVHFNPLCELRLNKTLSSQIDLIGSVIFERGQSQDNKNDFWENIASAFFNGAIAHVLASGIYDDGKKNISSIVGIVKAASAEKTKDEKGNDTDSGGETFLHEMVDSPHYDENGLDNEYINTYIKNCANQMIAMNPRVRSDVFSTLFSKLELFEDAYISDVTSRSDFALDDFYESKEPISLYLTVPYGQMNRVMPVFKLIINFILNKFSSQEIRLGVKEKKLSHRLLFLLDEFPSLGKQVQIMQNLGVLAGFGINFYIICQSLRQLDDIYGEKNTFMANCKTVMLYAPGELEEAKKISEIIGKESITKDSVSSSGSRYAAALNNLNLSSQEVQRELINPDELMKLPPSQCIILNQGMPPYVAKKNVYYDDPRFKYIAYSDHKVIRPKELRVRASKDHPFFSVRKGDVLFKFRLPFLTEKITPGFPAPYDIKDLMAECAGLPSQRKKRMAQRMPAASVPPALRKENKVMPLSGTSPDEIFSPENYLSSVREEDTGIPDTVSDGKDPPPGIALFDENYYKRHTA